jgi:hypothetical protein
MIETLADWVLGARFRAPRELEQLVPSAVTLRRGRLVPLVGGLLAGMRGPAGAVALGRTVIVHPNVRLSRRLLLHELEHVRQWQREPLFPLRYTLETVRNGYRDNRYERQARNAEGSAHAHPS